MHLLICTFVILTVLLIIVIIADKLIRGQNYIVYCSRENVCQNSDKMVRNPLGKRVYQW